MSQIAPATYKCQVVATHSVSLLEGRADIEVTVEAATECPDLENNSTSVNKSLSIKYLIENVEHNEIMPARIDNCTFRIVEMFPNDKSKYRASYCLTSILKIFVLYLDRIIVSLLYCSMYFDLNFFKLIQITF